MKKNSTPAADGRRDFRRFVELVKDMGLAPGGNRATSHTSAVSDFEEWHEVQQKLAERSAK